MPDLCGATLPDGGQTPLFDEVNEGYRQINAYFTDSCTILPPPGVAERILVIRKHIEALCEEKGEPRAMREARKHVGWYIHGMRGAAEFRRRAGELSTLEDLDRLLGDLYAANTGEE